MAELLAWYGGTFDPVHYGHLKPLEKLAQLAGLKKITLLPNNLPPHRPQPIATSQQRLAMLQLAIADNPLLAIDQRELNCSATSSATALANSAATAFAASSANQASTNNTTAAPSYTADTLQQLRDQYGAQQPIVFIIGQDSLLTFPQWHQPQQILACSHLLVCRRPGYPPALPVPWLASHLTSQIGELHQLPAGKICLTDTPLYPISSSEIRHRRQQGLSCQHILPPAVLHYIDQQGLYL